MRNSVRSVFKGLAVFVAFSATYLVILKVGGLDGPIVGPQDGRFFASLLPIIGLVTAGYITARVATNSAMLLSVITGSLIGLCSSVLIVITEVASSSDRFGFTMSIVVMFAPVMLTALGGFIGSRRAPKFAKLD